MNRSQFAPCLSLAVALVVLGTVMPAEARDRAGTVICGGVHTPRANFTEIIDTAYGFRNANLERPEDVRITRLTIRNFFGDVVDDFGEAAVPPRDLPTNRDIPPQFNFNITTVPAGASYYLTTSHIYGNTFMPSAPGAGNNISVVVEFSTAGDPDLFFVSGSLRTRELIGGVQGQEHARATITCQRLK